MLVRKAPAITFLTRVLFIPVLVLVVKFCYSSLDPNLRAQYVKHPTTRILTWPTRNITKQSSTFNSSTERFWRNLSSELVAAIPPTLPLIVEDGHPPDSQTAFNPLKSDATYPSRLVNFTDHHESALFEAHHRFLTATRRLAADIPFVRGSSGIVTSVNAKYVPIFLVSLRMLRRTGCRLPVEVFIDSWAKYDAEFCDKVLPPLNARCVVLSAIYDKADQIAQPNSYQYKMFAIFFSSFQHVMFLDSDVFPVFDPTKLFSTRPYTSHGLVLWPDLFALTISEHYYHIAAIAAESVTSRLSTESGQVMIDKDRQRESLLMMIYYNYYGPDYYYPLLCQGSHGAGDKETFIQAAMAVSLPWYQVKHGPSGLGRFENDNFHMSGLVQSDPNLDFEYQPPHQSHIHTDPLRNLEESNTMHDSADKKHFASSGQRPAFIHQNMHKLDPRTILKEGSSARDAEGNFTRMWGTKTSGINMFGYDVEHVLWQVIVEEGCRVDPEGETCRGLRDYLREVFHEGVE